MMNPSRAVVVIFLTMHLLQCICLNKTFFFWSGDKIRVILQNQSATIVFYYCVFYYLLVLSCLGKSCRTCYNQQKTGGCQRYPGLTEYIETLNMSVTKCRAFWDLLPLEKINYSREMLILSFTPVACIAISRGVEVMIIYYFIIKCKVILTPPPLFFLHEMKSILFDM